MANISISGIQIEYDLLGAPGAPAIALTPGGRFSMECPGVRELGEALAASGKRVLLWDRPNCGASDIFFTGDSESALQAQMLTKLIRALDLGPTAIAGGSAGARVSMLAAAYDPDIVSHLIMWWITGGPLMMIALASNNCSKLALIASLRGMGAVAQSPDWAEQINRNPGNRDRILAQDREAFIATMERWALAYLPSTDFPMPGLSAEDFARLRMPVLIFRNGEGDLTHPPETSERVHELIPHSRLVDPPWPDDEWNNRFIAAQANGSGHYLGWPMLASDILGFLDGDHA